jgi:SAM-dependent methyltransferase
MSFVPSYLTQLILCPTCGTPLRFDANERLCCDEPGGARIEDGMVRYRPDISSPEMMVRDRQAGGYLEHVKFPAQIDRMQRFIKGLLRPSRPVLDLGCGPGPTTQMLSERGFEVIAVDFSRRSLKLNRAKSTLFVQADLRDIRFAMGSVDGLMMADFLQHLGDFEVQEGFLKRAFEALSSGGWFFLSCFNANIKHILRRDINGAFADGNIRYVRSTPSHILKMLPQTVRVDSVRPMNIFHRPILDNVVTRLPMARLIAKMTVVTGRKLGITTDHPLRHYETSNPT